MISSGRFLKHCFIFAKTTYQKFNFDDCSNKSAASAFTTVFALVPLMTVFFSIFTSFPQFQHMKSNIQTYLFTQLLPGSALADTVVSYLTKFGSNTKAMGILGAVVFVASAVILVSQVELNFNSLWGIHKKRPLAKRVLIYYLTITVTPFLIAGSLYLTSNIQNLIYRSSTFVPYASFFSNYFAPYMMTTTALILIYKYLPYTHVEWKAAIISGITGAILWEVSKILFTYYVAAVVIYSKIYGSLSVIPIFLLYLFLCWIIFYFAAEIGTILQNYKGQKARKHFRFISFVDYISVLHLICTKYYDNTKSIRLSNISKTLAIPNDTVIKITDHLEFMGILEKKKRHSVIPALPISRIDLSLVWEEFIKLNPDSDYLEKNINLSNFIDGLSKKSMELCRSDNFKDLMKPL